LEFTLNLGENIFWNQPLTAKNILESTPPPKKIILGQSLTFENIGINPEPAGKYFWNQLNCKKKFGINPPKNYFGSIIKF